MASAATIPTVIQEDLQAFHLKHFNRSFTGVLPFPQSAQEFESTGYYEEEDDLGYYPDGIKRTLTDEQISIFRHSEVQRLLLAKLRREETVAEKSAEKKALREAGEDVSSDHDPLSEDDDDEEYRRFLEAEAKQFKKDTEEKRSKKRDNWMKKQEIEDRSVSTRRRVREMDGSADKGGQDNLVLDY